MDKEFNDFIAKVLENTDIIALISRYTHLERKGNTHWACCPFHHESQPSFSVSADKQLFHCFGCKKSGNALSFLMAIENIEFYDALKMLAEQAHMEIPRFSGGGQAHRVDKDRIATLQKLMRDAARHYHENLSSPRAKIFNDYLEERKIPPAMVRKFGLGASLDFSEMVDFLAAKGYSYELIHAAGIAEEKDGRKYDVFGKRLIYPIIDNMNNVVAFGGRTLEKDVHFAKYRNSTQTELFDKSKVIYGINLLKKRNSARPVEYVIMAEGYMDVIALHKAGFDTAVASMGTALTTRQARQLKLFSDLVYISYDGDTAGQKATMRGLDILKETGITVKVVKLPDGLDPDDVIKRGGAAAYQKLLDEAMPLTAYKIEVLRGKYDLSDPDRKAQFAIECANVVRSLDNPVEQEQYFDYISQLTGFSADALKQQANFAATEQQPTPPSRYDEYEDDTAEHDGSLKFFLSSLVQGADYVSYDYNVADAMPDEFSTRLYEWCRTRKSFSAAELSHAFGDDNRSLDALIGYKPVPGDNARRFKDVQSALYRRVLDDEIKKLGDMIKSTDDKQTVQEIIRRIGVLSIESKKLSNYRN